MKFAALALIFTFGSLSLYAQKWSVENPPGPQKKVTITTDEGTWMNLDVSPDGQTIVFDLLGDIYSMPIIGGKAALLAGERPGKYNPALAPMVKKYRTPAIKTAATIYG